MVYDTVTFSVSYYLHIDMIYRKKIMAVIGIFAWANIWNCALVTSSLFILAKIWGLSVWIFGMEALHRSVYLVQNNYCWILRSKLSVLCYGVVKWVFILFCTFLKLKKDNDCVLKCVSVVTDRDTCHQPDLCPEILTALSQCFTVTSSIQWGTGVSHYFPIPCFTKLTRFVHLIKRLIF